MDGAANTRLSGALRHGALQQPHRIVVCRTSVRLNESLLGVLCTAHDYHVPSRLEFYERPQGHLQRSGDGAGTDRW
jgi:hypothetical protein